MHQKWSEEFGVFLDAMDCPYYYEIRQCETDPEENNYADYVTSASTRYDDDTSSFRAVCSTSS